MKMIFKVIGSNQRVNNKRMLRLMKYRIWWNSILENSILNFYFKMY